MKDEKKEGTPQGEGEGVSLREIFHIIGKRIWYVLGGTLLVTILAVLIFMLAINPLMRSDSMSFQIDYPRYSEGKYPDGSVIDYHDMISQKVIEAAKNLEGYKDEFASLDTEHIIKNKGITISAQKKSETSPYMYTISLKKSCFKGVDSQDFIEAMTEAFISVIVVNEKVDNSFDFKLNEKIFLEASYKDQIALLSDLKGTLLSQYNNWISEYSAGRIVNGKPLSSYRADVITVFADNVKTPIENILTFKGYEYFNENVTAEDVRARVEQLQDELKLDLAILKELKNYYTETPSTQANELAPYAELSKRNNPTPYAGADESTGSTGGDIVIMPGDSDLSQKMAYYSERAAIIQQQIMRLTDIDGANETTNLDGINFNKIKEDIKKFGKDYLDGQLTALNQKAEILKTVISSIYSKDTAVIFSSQTVNSTGGTSLLLIGAGVFIVAFLVLCVVAYTVGKKRIAVQKESAPIDAEEEDKSE